jgi:ubiquinone/menaquinone biosynthesis C-methylase UbiE
MFFEQYHKLFDLDRDKDLKILEIGCGPGALAESLHRWYPNAHITGLDRDTKFIEFAKEKVSDISFVEGDATDLPFPDNTFDVTISNTVQEHIEPSTFWGEQRRVLKPGGVCLCLSTRKNIKCYADCLAATAAETAFWSNLPNDQDETEKYQVCRFPMSEAEIPASMEKHGFVNVSTGYAIIDLTPDDPKYPAPMAEAMIEADRQCALEAIVLTHSENTESVKSVVNSKFDERIRLYREGIKQWDTTTTVIMAVRGVK